MDKLILTKLNLDDVDGVHSLWSDEPATLYTNFPYLPSIEECRQRLGKVISYYEQSLLHFGPFAIRTSEGMFLGLVGGDANNPDPNTYEIWYFVRRKYWGQKVATRAVTKLLQSMRQSGRVHSVRAEAVVNNEPSWKLLEGLGFRRSGLLPEGHKKNGKTFDRYDYSLTII